MLFQTLATKVDTFNYSIAVAALPHLAGVPIEESLGKVLVLNAPVYDEGSTKLANGLIDGLEFDKFWAFTRPDLKTTYSKFDSGIFVEVKRITPAPVLDEDGCEPDIDLNFNTLYGTRGGRQGYVRTRRQQPLTPYQTL